MHSLIVKTFLFQDIQFSQKVLIQTIYISLSTVSMPKTVLFQTIQFYISTQFSSKLKIWNASRICASSLRKSHANLLYIIPILVYVSPKPVHFGFDQPIRSLKAIKQIKQTNLGTEVVTFFMAYFI